MKVLLDCSLLSASRLLYFLPEGNNHLSHAEKNIFLGNDLVYT